MVNAFLSLGGGHLEVTVYSVS